MYTQTRTSDYYTPIVVFKPDGRERQANILRGREMTPLQAIGELEAGRDAWVIIADAPQIREYINGRLGMGVGVSGTTGSVDVRHVASS